MRSVVIISLLLSVSFLHGSTTHPVYRFIDAKDLGSLEQYLEDHDVNAIPFDGSATLLAYAIQQDNLKVFRFLLEEGAGVNQISQGLYPLMIASRYAGTRIVKELIENAADLHISDSLNNTVLFYAAAGGKTKNCKVLLKNGIPLNHRNKSWQTAYDYAVLHGHTETARYLRQYFEHHLPDMRDGPYVKWKMFNRVHALYLVHDSTRRVTKRHHMKFKARSEPFLMEGGYGDSLTYLLYRTKDIPEDHFSNVGRILVVGDIHGGYDSLIKFLINNGVIDRDLQWTWGDGHLVFLGDVFDRGDKVTESLWLIYGLEDQALLSGGRVHYLLGNHEIMVLHKNEHYISDKYRLLTEKVNMEYSLLFSKRTLLGEWLRTKNTIVKINDLLFVHAGLSPAMLAYGLDIRGINDLTRFFLNHPERDNLEKIQRTQILGADGPFWYRGYIEGNHQYDHLPEEDFKKVLGAFGASKVFVGHTNVDHITPYYEGLVFTLDVPFYTFGYSMEAVLVEGNVITVLYSNGFRRKIQ